MRVIFTMVVVAIATVGCYKSELSNRGKAVFDFVMPELPDLPTGANMSEDFSLLFDGEEMDMKEGESLNLGEIDPGIYPLYIYNQARSITVEVGEESVVASVATSDGVADDQAGIMLFDSHNLTIKSNTTATLQFDIKPIVRPLIFDIQIEKGDASRISTIDATLTGIASQWECISDTPMGAPVLIKPTIELGAPETRAVDDGRYSCIAYLLGVIGDEQILTLNITFNDGLTQEVKVDVSSVLSSFNGDKSNPFTLLCNFNTPAEGGFTGTVNGWDIEDGGDVTVN